MLYENLLPGKIRSEEYLTYPNSIQLHRIYKPQNPIILLKFLAVLDIY